MGAGFSRYAGLPLGSEIFQEVVAEAKEGVLYKNVLKPDLDRFRLLKKVSQGIEIEEGSVDAEEFIAFLDVEHFLRLKGSDVYSEEADRSQQLVKNLIAKILLARQSAIRPAQWGPYLDFTCRLQPGDFVLTFNYDTVLETALERVGKPYRLDPDRFDEVLPGGGIKTSEETDVVVLKLHGSIDWFDIDPWERQREYFSRFPRPIRDRHPVFGDPNSFNPKSIVVEPYFEDCQLRRIRRIQNLEGYLAKASLVIEAPLILAPSYQKLLSSSPLKELWWGMAEAGSLMETVAVVGFSLPVQDEYMVQAIYGILRNFQYYKTGDLIKKRPLRFVDWCPTEKETQRLQDRYRFVDWERAELDEAGFRPETIPFLFG